MAVGELPPQGKCGVSWDKAPACVWQGQYGRERPEISGAYAQSR